MANCVFGFENPVVKTQQLSHLCKKKNKKKKTWVLKHQQDEPSPTFRPLWILIVLVNIRSKLSVFFFLLFH